MPGFRFDSPPRPIDQVILSMSGGPFGSNPRVSRAEALAVPGILRGRNMICSIATLPLFQYNAANRTVPNPLLTQTDRDVANVVMFAMTLEDLLFESIAWWRITERDGDLFPTKARHLDVSTVSVDPPDGTPPPLGLPSGIDPRGLGVWINGEFTRSTEVIRFDSPNPAVLRVAGRSIRRATLLENASNMYAEDPRPLDYFRPSEGAEEIPDDEVKNILAGWKAERKKRGTAYVPRALEYNSVDAPSPQQLQLVELQRQATLDVANALGIDPEDLGISTTSRTYANAVDRRRDRVNDVLSPYMQAIEQRLSMDDVTRRGNRIAFKLDDYMRANPTERWNTHKIASDIGAMTIDEIRNEEGMPPLTPEQRAELKPPPPPVPAVEDTPSPAGEPNTTPADDDAARANSRRAVLALAADGAPWTFDVPVPMAFRVDRERRIIEGVAIPYGVVVSKGGFKFRFLRNSITWNERAPGRVKLLEDHDTDKAIGFAKGLRNSGDELRTRWKVGRGPAGDAALMSAEDGVKDGLSVGVDFDFDTDIEMDADGVANVRHAVLREVSLTAVPAFDDARVTSVAASRGNNGGLMETCATCGQRHAPDAACPTAPPTNNPTQQGTPAPLTVSANQANAALALSADQLTALLTMPGAIQALAQPAAPAQPATPPGALTLSADQVQALIATGGIRTLFGLPAAEPTRGAAIEPGPSVVNPTAHPTPGQRQTAVTAAREPIPYRFDREGNLTAGATFDFSRDLIAGSKGDGEALGRATEFVKAMKHQFTYGPARAQFDVDTTDTAGLNPNRNRPDMYVDQKDFSYPIWDAISKGTLADQTPFVLPKFNTASGLVADHVQGVEPTPGAFTATSQTITPSALSGKVEITREAWDQGGNPQLSGIIWRQMVKSWFEGLEAAAVAMLDALTPTGITLTTAATDDALVAELESALAALQFIRGGFRFRDMFLQVDLYKALVDAKDADGRKLLPRIGPVNANGSVSDFFADLDVGGLRGRPAWALAASGTVAASSYLFDRNDVHGWASAPQRLEFQYRVAYVDVGIWGYKALANTDLTGVREIIYDPA